MVGYAGKFPWVRDSLLKNRDLISNAFENLSEGVLENYEDNEREKKGEQFNSAKIAWLKFIDAEHTKRNSSVDSSSAH